MHRLAFGTPDWIVRDCRLAVTAVLLGVGSKASAGMATTTQGRPCLGWTRCLLVVALAPLLSTAVASQRPWMWLGALQSDSVSLSFAPLYFPRCTAAVRYGPITTTAREVLDVTDAIASTPLESAVKVQLRGLRPLTHVRFCG